MSCVDMWKDLGAFMRRLTELDTMRKERSRL
jgi:hypothetical protein